MLIWLSTDLLTIEPHMPTPEPMSYDRTDGQWYAHDGVDIKETQSRKGNQIFALIYCSKMQVGLKGPWHSLPYVNLPAPRL